MNIMNAIETIKRYLPNLAITQRKIELKGIPVFFKALYRFVKLTINDEYYLLVNVEDMAIGPRDLKKHSKVLSERNEYPIIWFFEELHFHKIQRLIQNGENFVVANKQVHLPCVGASIKAERTKRVAKQKRWSGLAINILIRELLVGDLSGKNKKEIAEIFSVNQMTVGRALDVVIGNDLCIETKVGVSKQLQFLNRDELWRFFQDYMKTPVTSTVYLNVRPKSLPLSGISALSRLTMLADDSIETFAISKKAYEKTFRESDITIDEEGAARLEIWDREPILLENNIINVLDLFLVHKNNNDERVQIELEDALQQHDFKLGMNDD